MERQIYNNTDNLTTFTIALSVIAAIVSGIILFTSEQGTQVASDTTGTTGSIDAPAAKEKLEPEK